MNTVTARDSTRRHIDFQYSARKRRPAFTEFQFHFRFFVARKHWKRALQKMIQRLSAWHTLWTLQEASFAAFNLKITAFHHVVPHREIKENEAEPVRHSNMPHSVSRDVPHPLPVVRDSADVLEYAPNGSSHQTERHPSFHHLDALEEGSLFPEQSPFRLRDMKHPVSSKEGVVRDERQQGNGQKDHEQQLAAPDLTARQIVHHQSPGTKCAEHPQTAGHDRPTPLRSAALPALGSGRDVKEPLESDGVRPNSCGDDPGQEVHRAAVHHHPLASAVPMVEERGDAVHCEHRRGPFDETDVVVPGQLPECHPNDPEISQTAEPLVRIHIAFAETPLPICLVEIILFVEAGGGWDIGAIPVF